MIPYPKITRHKDQMQSNKDFTQNQDLLSKGESFDLMFFFYKGQSGLATGIRGGLPISEF